jgi:hypothetical protein
MRRKRSFDPVYIYFGGALTGAMLGCVVLLVGLSDSPAPVEPTSEKPFSDSPFPLLFFLTAPFWGLVAGAVIGWIIGAIVYVSHGHGDFAQVPHANRPRRMTGAGCDE